MYRLTLIALLLISAPLVASTESDIETALDYYAEVWNEKDMEAINSYYHSDFILVSDTGVLSRQQWIDDITSVGARGGDRGELSHTAIKVKELGDDHAIAYGKGTLRFKDGSSIENWFTTVYKKTPFGWKAILTRN